MDTKTRSKGEQTKDLILSTAIYMFQWMGYESTTMRAIAQESGVALGNAYYYFQSKEHLVLALYERTLSDQWAACKPVLSSCKSMRKRLSGVLHAQLGALKPYRDVLNSLFKFGADPKSPLSPFASETLGIRESAQMLFRNVVAGSQEKISADIGDALPYCLWLYHMGVVFFWLHDSSAGQRKTTKLIDLTSELIVSLILLSSMPIFKPFRRTLLKLIEEFRPDDTA